MRRWIYSCNRTSRCPSSSVCEVHRPPSRVYPRRKSTCMQQIGYARVCVPRPVLTMQISTFSFHLSLSHASSRKPLNPPAHTSHSLLPWIDSLMGSKFVTPLLSSCKRTSVPNKGSFRRSTMERLFTNLAHNTAPELRQQPECPCDGHPRDEAKQALRSC